MPAASEEPPARSSAQVRRRRPMRPHPRSPVRSASAAACVGVAQHSLFEHVFSLHRHTSSVGQAANLRPIVNRPSCLYLFLRLSPTLLWKSRHRLTPVSSGYDDVDVDREQAWEILCEFTKPEGLRKHALAVETCVAAYARKLGEDEPSGRSRRCCTISIGRSIPRSTSIRRTASRFWPSAA